jgi:precorrin-6Y C5,15-methyltransferase (decarboxylating)
VYKLYLLGISGQELTAEQKRIVKRCGAVVVSSRYHQLITAYEKNIIPMAPVKEMLAAVTGQLEKSDVAVLATGDPLFYGIGRKLLATFGPEEVEIYPGVSSMQLAFSRCKEPWDDAVFVSLHGRSADNLARMLLPHRKVFVLTDRRNSPAVVAATLLGHLRACGQESVAESYEVMVGENLGLAEERLVRGSLEEISGQSFADLNVMILKREPKQRLFDFPLGLQEGEIAHSRGLITKDEVRAATLHRLRLPDTGVFWDIGAGSGSISVEAARLCPQLHVFAVERNIQELENIRANIRRYELHNISVVEGEAPAALAGLPAPDRVFVGGSGGRLAEIIRSAARELVDSGRIVVNGVIEQTRQMAPALLHDCGLEVTISEISVSRRQYPATDVDPLVFNTIAVITGIKLS